MKLKIVYPLLLILVFVSSTLIHKALGNSINPGRVKAISITVSGKILNDSTGKPVKNHGVIVKEPFIGYISTVYTDSAGNYVDTIRGVPGLGDTLTVCTYDCDNILHTQSQPIQSYSLVINFFICETFNPECIADFIAELDSSSVKPYTYRFIDLSKGNPDHWIWDFGDGSISTDRNPIHSYTGSGNYKVCLLIIRDNPGMPCTDSSCSYIYTPKYYSIGGHVFAGTHPINNPESTGDTAVAYLYKLQSNHIIAFDTLTFSYLGYYTFPNLLDGDYIVKVFLTPGSANSRKYCPTYYIQTAFWQQSQLLRISGSSVFDFDVHLTRSNDSLSGPGKISGRVEWHTVASGYYSLYRSEVLLLDSLKHLITYTLSDASGNFSFPSIPYGNYLLFVESTNRFSKFTQVRISPQNPVVDTLVLEIFDHSVTGIREIANNNEVVAGLPFPNPSNGMLSIPLTVYKPVDLITSIYSIQSVPLFETTSHCNPGSLTLVNELTDLPPGIYILMIRTKDGQRISMDKIIKF